MFKSLFRDVRVVVVAVLLSSALVAGPAMAAYDALNADKVDGKSAVGAAASVKERRGKLVATNSRGYLPNNIVKTAPNSAKLGGLTAADFQKRVSSVGELQTGSWAVSSSAASPREMAFVKFDQALQRVVGAGSVQVIPAGGPYSGECPEPGAVTTTGVLCIYLVSTNDLSSVWASRADVAGVDGASTDGFVLNADFSNQGWAYGTYAVRSDSPIVLVRQRR